MKYLGKSVKKRLISRDLDSENVKSSRSITDINVLLNRVKLDKELEIRKKFYFSAAASTGLILFGFIIFY
tara:strand:+ start:883 stop:1092 length:210 start_codon:yes stop_codon:yes gene_type:complete